MRSHGSFWEAVVGAVQSLRGSKLRSFLTLLGIVLATTTLIAVMSVISGMNAYIADKVSSMGTRSSFKSRTRLSRNDDNLAGIDLRRQLSTQYGESLRMEAHAVDIPASVDIVDV